MDPGLKFKATHSKMQLRHLKTIQPPGDNIARISTLTWCPNNRRLAVCTADKAIHLFDENGERKDRFPTKPADSKVWVSSLCCELHRCILLCLFPSALISKGPKNYVVTSMAWSPDSSKLAIAQSDNIVFIYKLGLEWFLLKLQ